jgi:hypothetical protein
LAKINETFRNTSELNSELLDRLLINLMPSERPDIRKWVKHFMVYKYSDVFSSLSLGYIVQKITSHQSKAQSSEATMRVNEDIANQEKFIPSQPS